MIDWMAAEAFWETRETWSFFRKIQEAFRLDRAFLTSHHWLTSPQDLQYRKHVFSEAAYEVKAFRRHVKRSQVTADIINTRKATVYGTYAHAMNEVEIWTGKPSECWFRQHFLTSEQTIVFLVLCLRKPLNIRKCDGEICQLFPLVTSLLVSHCGLRRYVSGSITYSLYRRG